MSNKEHSALTRVLVDVLYAAAIFFTPKTLCGRTGDVLEQVESKVMHTHIFTV